MKKSLFHRWIILTLTGMTLFLGLRPALPCTVFCLQDSQQVLVGKNLDWPIPEGVVFYNPSGFIRAAMAADSGKSTWQAQYASLTVNQLGRNLPMGGINDAGLVIESTAYSPSVFSTYPEVLPLNEFEWIQYHLDRSATTAAVIASAKKLPPRKWFIALHYFVCDQDGNAAILEWLDGKLHVYTGETLPYPVQVNNTYARSLKYLTIHQGFGGDRRETNGPESPERFVRATRMYLKPPVPVAHAAVFAGLDRVKQGDTQLSVIYDLPKRTLFVDTRDETLDQQFSQADLTGAFGGETVFRVIKSTDTAAVSSEWQHYDLAADIQVMDLVLEQLLALDELSPAAAAAYRNQWLKFQRRIDAMNGGGVSRF